MFGFFAEGALTRLGDSEGGAHVVQKFAHFFQAVLADNLAQRHLLDTVLPVVVAEKPVGFVSVVSFHCDRPLRISPLLLTILQTH